MSMHDIMFKLHRFLAVSRGRAGTNGVGALFLHLQLYILNHIVYEVLNTHRVSDSQHSCHHSCSLCTSACMSTTHSWLRITH